ncbi:MAG TPA: Hsp20/alpha crystallin family protein [Bryobacteraceae bacterium]|nr:Hsp20/alpha crystallin family protein [Bryobacteraceae bacterium]
MSEVKVQKQQTSPTRPEFGVSPFNNFFTPLLPVGRLFGMNPFAMMREFTNEMDRAFGGLEPSLQAWAPAVDIQRCNGSLIVTAELPGLRKEEVRVEVSDHALIIEGERKREHKEDHEGYHRYERSYGKFYRSIPLPEGAKTDQARAELNEGILKISLPAPEAAKPEERRTRIPVEAGSPKAGAAA